MSNRVELNDELMESVIGGTITFDWDGSVGHCGLNGDKSYTFTSRGDLIAFCKVCSGKFQRNQPYLVVVCDVLRGKRKVSVDGILYSIMWNSN